MAGKTKEMTADLEEAAKKDASEVVRAAEMAARAPAKVAEDGDPNMEAQEIFIPMNPASPEDTEITVGLNGKLYKIQRGVKTAVPKAVVEIDPEQPDPGRQGDAVYRQCGEWVSLKESGRFKKGRPSSGPAGPPSPEGEGKRGGQRW